MVQDLDLAVPHAADARRLEVVVDGLPLFCGAQLAVDTTLVCALHANGSARRGAAHTDGVALTAARRRKEATFPELVGRRGRARLVVLAVEVGGRWSLETQSFLSQLASAKARAASPLMRRRVEQAGDFGGAPCCPVQLPELWQCHCWSGRGLEVQTALARPFMRRDALACSLVWLSESGRAFCVHSMRLHFVYEISFQQRVSKKKGDGVCRASSVNTERWCQCRHNSRQGNGCSHIWMTFTLCVRLKEWGRCI